MTPSRPGGDAHPSDPAPDNPFEDPEFVAQLQRMGISHRPGMARELMGELAPLLKDEGIDLDQPVDMDLDSLNAALARASERRNMELMTPIGLHRDLTLTVLRRFCELTEAGDEGRAAATLALVPIEETADRPAISHVIGVSLGLLDTWFRERPTRKALAQLDNAPAVRRSRAAVDVVAAASRKRAFASSRSLNLAHGGLAVMQGAAVSVAAAVRAVARATRTPVPATCARLLIADDRYPDLLSRFLGPGSVGGSPRPGTGGVRPTALPFGVPLEAEDRALVESFESWLTTRLTDRLTDARMPGEVEDLDALVADETEELSSFVEMVRAIGEDPRDVEVVGEMAAEVLRRADDVDADEDSAQRSEYLLTVLGDYTLHRGELVGELERASWADLHGRLAFRYTIDRVQRAVDAAMAETSPRRRRAAQAATRMCTAVVEVLRWMGDGRPATSAGWLRRADIEPVAAMLGIRARGSSHLGNSDSEVREVQSMGQVRLLAAWWSALHDAGVLEFTASRVRPGRTARQWLDPHGPTLAASTALIAACTTECLVPSPQGYIHNWELGVAAQATVVATELLGAPAPAGGDAVAPTGDAPLPVAPSRDEQEQWEEHARQQWDRAAAMPTEPWSRETWMHLDARLRWEAANRRIDLLHTLGLVGGPRPDPWVSVALRPAVGRGVLAAIDAITDAADDEGADRRE